MVTTMSRSWDHPSDSEAAAKSYLTLRSFNIELASSESEVDIPDVLDVIRTSKTDLKGKGKASVGAICDISWLETSVLDALDSVDLLAPVKKRKPEPDREAKEAERKRKQLDKDAAKVG
jgi:hypothetical protein